MDFQVLRGEKNMDLRLQVLQGLRQVQDLLSAQVGNSMRRVVGVDALDCFGLDPNPGKADGFWSTPWSLVWGGWLNKVIPCSLN